VIFSKSRIAERIKRFRKDRIPVDRSKKKGGPVALPNERGRDKKRPRKRIDKARKDVKGK